MQINHDEILNRTDLDDCKNLANGISGHLKKDYAIIAGITGGVGTGKSTLGTWLSYLINPFEFEMEKNIAMKPTTDAFIEQFEGLKPYSGIVGDEGAWYAFNRTFMSSFQIYLMQYLKTFRKHHNKAVLLCMTSIHKFDKDLRSGDTMFYWIHILRRGTAAIFESTKNFFSNDGFRIKENEKLFEKWRSSRRFIDIDSQDIAEFLEKKATNFIDIIEFPDMPPPWKRNYLDLTMKTKEWYAQYRKDMETHTNIREEKRYENLVRSVSWLYDGDEKAPPRTFREIADKLGIAESTVFKWVKEAENMKEKEQKL